MILLQLNLLLVSFFQGGSLLLVILQLGRHGNLPLEGLLHARLHLLNVSLVDGVRVLTVILHKAGLGGLSHHFTGDMLVHLFGLVLLLLQHLITLLFYCLLLFLKIIHLLAQLLALLLGSRQLGLESNSFHVQGGQALVHLVLSVSVIGRFLEFFDLSDKFDILLLDLLQLLRHLLFLPLVHDNLLGELVNLLLQLLRIARIRRNSLHLRLDHVHGVQRKSVDAAALVMERAVLRRLHLSLATAQHGSALHLHFIVAVFQQRYRFGRSDRLGAANRVEAAPDDRRADANLRGTIRRILEILLRQNLNGHGEVDIVCLGVRVHTEALCDCALADVIAQVDLLGTDTLSVRVGSLRALLRVQLDLELHHLLTVRALLILVFLVWEVTVTSHHAIVEHLAHVEDSVRGGAVAVDDATEIVLSDAALHWLRGIEA